MKNFKVKKKELNNFISELRVYKQFFSNEESKEKESLIEDFLNGRTIYYDFNNNKYTLTFKNKEFEKHSIELPIIKKPISKFLKNHWVNKNDLFEQLYTTFLKYEK